MSDLGVGALVQPLYITYKAAEVNDNFRMFCVAGIGFHLSANVFSAVSFLTVTAIAIDRLLALHLKKGYNAAISLRRVAILLLLLWSATSLWVIAWIMSIKIYQIFNIASVFVCLLICASAYVTLQTRLRMLQNSMIASRFQTQDTESQRQHYLDILVAFVLYYEGANKNFEIQRYSKETTKEDLIE
ncbi:hypothetical protein pdam_00003805 [Pocillopora damicornis]|uniref:G-protein coupled receptors family 1 profile domain-containing protein n=1 Tax=Pocillopora damicornis TaxID=46731 RepID=A0A3M6T4U6_POCDA|nr:hypothetical protein pdam_00003805 [Pocillopora damicornis]